MPRVEYIAGLPSVVGNAITAAVREFAQEYNLTAEVWVHDAPLWFVSSTDADRGIGRRVQVGAYRLDTSEEVRMVPQVFRLDHQLQRLVAFEQIEPDLIEKMPLNSATEPKNVKQHLAQARGKALKMEPPPSNPTAAVISVPVSRNYRVLSACAK